MRFGNNVAFTRMAKNRDFDSYELASINGIAYKSILLIGVAIISALLSMIIITRGTLNLVGTNLIIGFCIAPIITLILSFIISFRPHTAKALGVPYAILEGLSVGSVVGLLMYFEPIFGLYAALALTITLSYFLGASILISTKIIKISDKFKRFMFVALFGLVVSTLLVSLISIFVPNLRYALTANFGLMLAISIISVLIAALYVFVTIDNVFNIVENGISIDYEWYAAFGITLNFIWLFMEIFRLIVLISGRRD